MPMPKKRTPEQDPDEVAPMFYATTKYKLWVRRRLAEKGRGEAGDSPVRAKPWSLIRLEREIKRIDPAARVSDASLSQFLGREDEIPRPSNTTIMPMLNRVLGAAPPAICDPDDEIAQLRDRIAASWSDLTDRERSVILAMFTDGKS